MRIIWHPSAIDDLEDILDYIANHNHEAAFATFALITGNISMLANQPFMGREGRVAGTRELVVSKTSYIIAYEIRDDVVSILSVLHGALVWPQAFQ